MAIESLQANSKSITPTFKKIYKNYMVSCALSEKVVILNKIQYFIVGVVIP